MIDKKKFILQNVFYKMYFTKCILQNVFYKISNNNY